MGKRILTVDDSATFRMILGVSLRQAGYEVLEARDGSGALEILERDPVDLVITDLTMPAMDGIELTRKIRLLPKHLSTPVILLTTEGEESKKEEGRRAGATGWMVKPFKHDVLISVVEDLLP